MRPAVRILLLGWLFVFGSVSGRAQVVDATNLGDSIDLSGNWRMQAGDDMQWARPDFDDSHWRVITTLRSFHAQQIGRPKDMFWYRLRIRLPAQHEPLSLLFNYTGIPYELYVNGE